MGVFDGFEFANGMAIGAAGKHEQVGEVALIAASWKKRAQSMAKELNEAEEVILIKTYRMNGAISLLKEMLEEIQESNPNSPLANRNYLRERLKVLAEQDALQDGYELDYENNRVTPK